VVAQDGPASSAVVESGSLLCESWLSGLLTAISAALGGAVYVGSLISGCENIFIYSLIFPDISGTSLELPGNDRERTDSSTE
jgi:hypothetical protein